MKHLSKILLTTLSLATLAAPALAQDAAEGEAPAEGEAAAPAEGEAAPAEAAPAEEAPAAAGQGIGPFTKESYPSALIDRPLTLPAGMIEVRPSLQYLNLTITDPLSGASASFSATGLGVGVGYGITDKIEAGLSTGLGIDPDVEWSESIGLYGAFSAIDTAKMDIAPSVSTELDFADGADVLSAISIGAGFRYLVSDKLFVRAGNNLLNLVIAPDAGLQLNVNGGIGFQATPELAIAADLNMISLKVFGDAVGDSTFFDPFGLTLTGLYAISNKLDAYVQIALPSIADAADIYGISVGANVRL